MGLVLSGWVVLTARQQAYTDPPSGAAYRPLTGVGSATTQDVMNALAEVITVDGQKVMGSFSASGSERVTTFDPSNLRTCDFPRPATDEAAMSRLLFSAVNRHTCVSFARMTFPHQDGYRRPLRLATVMRRSGSSVMRPSTPRLITRCMVGSSLTV